MKRIIISIVLFALCLSGAVFEVFCVSRGVDGYIESIEGVDRLVSRGEFDHALYKCAELEKSWSKTSRAIDAVLIHDYVDRIGISITQMKAYAENKTADSYYAVSYEAKKALKSIKDSEYPSIENIL